MRRSLAALSVFAASLSLAASAGAQQVLKLATQVLAVQQDARKEVTTVFANGVAEANSGVTVKIYYEGELVGAAEMWNAMRSGTIDMAFIFMPTSVRDVPEVGIAGMPGLMTTRAEVKKMQDSEAMRLLGKALEAKGILMVGDYWDGLAVGSARGCVRRPEGLDGVVARGAGRWYDLMLENAGAIPVPFPAAEIPRALKTGAVEMVITSPSSMMAGGGHKFLKCVSDTKNFTVGMSQTAMLIAKASYDKLSKDQQAAIHQGVAKARAYMDAELAKNSANAIEKMRSDGLEVGDMNADDMAAWQSRASESAFREYAKLSPQSAEIMKAALQTLGRE